MNVIKSLVIALFVSVNSFAGDQAYDSGSFFVELPEDGYCNTSYGANVIHGKKIYNTDSSLPYRKSIIVDSPKQFLEKWPTVNYSHWIALENYKGGVRSDRLTLRELSKLWQENRAFDHFAFFKCNLELKGHREYNPACCEIHLIELGFLPAKSKTQEE